VTKPVSARIHGVIDYATVAAFLNAPMVFGFHGTPAAVAYWIAGIHLLMTGCTDFPVGFFKWIPFRIHGVIELLAALLVLAAPWAFGFAQDVAARNFFLAMGIVVLIVIAVTDYSQRVVPPQSDPADRRRWRAPS
jgi:hypothetical protein